MVLPVLFVFFLAGFGRAVTTVAAASRDFDFDVVPPEMLPQWEARTGLPMSEAAAGLHHPITFANATHGFVLTGSTWTDSYTTALYIYEAATDTWTAPAASFSSSSSAYVFPGAPRSYGYGVASHDLCGTKTTTAYFGFGAGPNGIFYNDFWKLEMTTGQFTPLADFPGAGRKHPAMNYLEDVQEIHVGLGDGAEGNYQDYWSYSIANNVWTQLPDFPATPRHHPYYFSLGTASYVGLGHSDGSAPYIERDWYKFETRTQQWSAEPEFVSYPLGGVSRGDDEDDNDERLLPITTEGRVAGTQFTMMIDDISRDGSMLSSCETNSSSSSSSSRNRTTISRTSYGFILSGDGDDHGSMEMGEFHMYDPTASGSDTSSKHWRALPPHPGVSRFAPGSFVLQGTTNVYMVGGYDRRNGILHRDLWTIDLQPLFVAARVNDTIFTDTIDTINANDTNSSSSSSSSSDIIVNNETNTSTNINSSMDNSNADENNSSIAIPLFPEVNTDESDNINTNDEEEVNEPSSTSNPILTSEEDNDDDDDDYGWWWTDNSIGDDDDNDFVDVDALSWDSWLNDIFGF